MNCVERRYNVAMIINQSHVQAGWPRTSQLERISLTSGLKMPTQMVLAILNCSKTSTSSLTRALSRQKPHWIGSSIASIICTLKPVTRDNPESKFVFFSMLISMSFVTQCWISKEHNAVPIDNLLTLHSFQMYQAPSDCLRSRSKRQCTCLFRESLGVPCIRISGSWWVAKP